MKSRNIITLTLMTASILLLLVLQVLWLQNSYEKAFFDLRRDSNFIFRSTLFSLRDSIFLKSVKAVPYDSLFPEPANIQSLQIVKKRDGDSLRVNMKSSSTVQLFVRGSVGNKDSVLDVLRPMARNFNFHQHDGKQFVVQLAPDTINLDTLKKVFSKSLDDANLPVKFLLRHELSPPEKTPMMRVRMDAPFDQKAEEVNMYRDTLRLEVVRLNPGSRYFASLLNFKGLILKAIAPQIAFSLLLTVITIMTFIVLYKNLRSQQRLMELKNDFISNVTHELKTPVATVSVALEALKNFHGLDNPALTKEYLEIAQSELNRLTLMTDKILKAGAFENNIITIERKPVDVRQITQQILDSMKLLFDKQHAQISFETTGKDFTINGEATHLTNVIYNLLDNALKYSPHSPTISITLKEEAGSLKLSVQDNGLGIPAEYRKKIFEKFFRVPTGDVHNIKGYGLGLSYVASVVKAHDGVVGVESEPGKGSIFVITLPKSSA